VPPVRFEAASDGRSGDNITEPVFSETCVR